jgi:hypothetical protein
MICTPPLATPHTPRSPGQAMASGATLPAISSRQNPEALFGLTGSSPLFCRGLYRYQLCSRDHLLSPEV